MFAQLLKPHIIKAAQEYKDLTTGKVGIPAGRFDDEWDGWSSGQKEVRICDTLEPILGNHRLVVDRRVIDQDLIVQEDKPQYSVIQQFSRMERLKGALPNEDRLDALAMACDYWVERMDRDKDKMEAKHKDGLLAAELKKFATSIFSRNRGRMNMGSPKAGPARFIKR